MHLRILLLFLGLLVLYNGNAQKKEPLPYTISEGDTSKFLFEYKLFYVGSNVHIDLNYQYVLEHLVELLEANPNWKIEVRGHVCCGPSLRISKRRARKVYNFLKRSGIHKSRITFTGYSDEMPMAFPEKTEDDERVNRRVDFVITR